MTESLILFEKQNALGIITINRPEKRNAFTFGMLRRLADLFTEADRDESIRALVVRAEGTVFTAGLDLADVAPHFMEGERPILPDHVDPFGLFGRTRTKPLITAVKGHCLTLGFELCLASDVCIVAKNTIFALREVRMGIVPAGGGIPRLIQSAGWNTAMRYILTGDDIDAEQAAKLHLITEIVETGQEVDRAFTLATSIASQPPLAVRAAIEQAHTATYEGFSAAGATIPPAIQRLIRSDDAREAVMAAMQRRTPVFVGR